MLMTCENLWSKYGNFNFFSLEIWRHFCPKKSYVQQRGSPFFFVAKWKNFGTKKCPITHRSLFTHGLPRYLLLGTICQHSHQSQHSIGLKPTLLDNSVVKSLFTRETMDNKLSSPLGSDQCWAVLTFFENRPFQFAHDIMRTWSVL
jgi:hypothetical protein